jgi:hypothetical protein
MAPAGRVERSPDAPNRRFRDTRRVPARDPEPTTSELVTELIQSGRDREAAELGDTERSPDTTTEPNSTQ